MAPDGFCAKIGGNRSASVSTLKGYGDLEGRAGAARAAAMSSKGLKLPLGTASGFRPRTSLALQHLNLACRHGIQGNLAEAATGIEALSIRVAFGLPRARAVDQRCWSGCVVALP